jgi:small subunit ribosomal protein S9
MDKYLYAYGRRKTAIATVRLFNGKGVSTVNGKPLNEVFPVAVDQMRLLKPFAVAELNADDYYFTAQIKGSGPNGQLEALRLAISKALASQGSELRAPLKKAKLLVRDPRMVERKKAGHLKARKSEQYSKR